MKTDFLGQKWRMIYLFADIIFLLGVSYFYFDGFIPKEKSEWFTVALLGLILGVHLDTPFFVKPVDSFLYAAPATISFLTFKEMQGTLGQYITLAYCIFVAAASVVSILAFSPASNKRQNFSNTLRILAEQFGTPKKINTLAIFAICYHRHLQDLQELGAIFAAWGFVLLSPIKFGLMLYEKISKSNRKYSVSNVVAEVLAYQNPGVFRIQTFHGRQIRPLDLILINDPAGALKIALVLDYVGRNEREIYRVVQVPELKPSEEAMRCLANLPTNAIVEIKASDIKGESSVISRTNDIAGILAPESTQSTIYFSYSGKMPLVLGDLVEVASGAGGALYQIVECKTKECSAYKSISNTYIQVQARAIGVWQGGRFHVPKQVAAPNSIVLKASSRAEHNVENQVVIGSFPNHDFPIAIRDIRDIVTHNTAIIGVLGSGKSTLAMGLIRLMINQNLKVICVDPTNEYTKILADLIAPENKRNEESLIAAGTRTITPQTETHELFQEELKNQIKRYLESHERNALIYNPGVFRTFQIQNKQRGPELTSLEPREFAKILSEICLEQVMKEQGNIDANNPVCIVFEEAHLTLPESSSGETKNLVSSLVQGRKYGLGFLMISQRTVGVSKGALSQCNTVFAMRMFDDAGIDFVANYTGREFASMLPNISDRQAIFVGKASCSLNPVLVEIKNLCERPQDTPDPVSDPESEFIKNAA